MLTFGKTDNLATVISIPFLLCRKGNSGKSSSLLYVAVPP